MFQLIVLKENTINSIDTTINSYENVVFFKNENGEISAFISTAPSLNNGDRVVISGIKHNIITRLKWFIYYWNRNCEEVSFIKKFLILLQLVLLLTYMYQKYQSNISSWK